MWSVLGSLAILAALVVVFVRDVRATAELERQWRSRPSLSEFVALGPAAYEVAKAADVPATVEQADAKSHPATTREPAITMGSLTPSQ